MLVPFLVVLGVFFTIISGFVQFKYFIRMFRVLSSSNQSGDPNTITAREALLLSVGGGVGGGNIAGVAVAITLGGPGAVFWMWAIAIVGMTTSLIECSLAQLFKEREADGSFRGGPARTIIHGLGADYKWLAILCAICLIAALGRGFPAFQGNTVAGAAQDSKGIDRLIIAIVLAAGTAIIVYGGIHRIAKTADVVVPIMAIDYIGLALIFIVMNIGEIPGVIYTLVANAIGIEGAVSGGMSAVIAQDLRRGLFSNEAGLGSAPNVAATADVRHPVSQGITQSFSVFIDTTIICSCTAFVILLGDIYVPGAEGIDGVALTQQSLVSLLGASFLTASILLVAFSSVIYNYYLGENAMTVMTRNPLSIHALRIGITAIVFLGAVVPEATSVFFFSDTIMGVLAVVNLLALTMLFPIAKRLLNDFRGQLKAGVVRPAFDPDKFPDLNIDRTAWIVKETEK